MLTRQTISVVLALGAIVAVCASVVQMRHHKHGELFTDGGLICIKGMCLPEEQVQRYAGMMSATDRDRVRNILDMYDDRDRSAAAKTTGAPDAVAMKL